MTITLNNVWKSYENEWVLRDLSIEFLDARSYAILGPNGSGKSTLLQLLAGNVSPSRGEIKYTKGDKKIPVEEIYRYIGFSSPYMELPEDLTLRELMTFHGGFKTYLDNMLA